MIVLLLCSNNNLVSTKELDDMTARYEMALVRQTNAK
jgi:hypothetical protein